jgi:exodeoxyribonuclease VII small subunit
MADEPAVTDLPFEAALDRLDRIVREMEDSALPLQRMLVLFEEGTFLGRRCQELLDLAELRIKQVVEDADGSLHLRGLDDGVMIDGAGPAF